MSEGRCERRIEKVGGEGRQKEGHIFEEKRRPSTLTRFMEAG